MSKNYLTTANILPARADARYDTPGGVVIVPDSSSATGWQLMEKNHD